LPIDAGHVLNPSMEKIGARGNLAKRQAGMFSGSRKVPGLFSPHL
jgi:hypothetical protein